jgi:hypothetical protein
MDEKLREAWEVSLAFLQDRRQIATIGAHCNGCGHKHRWLVEDLIAEHKPSTTVVELARRWKCSRCSSRDVVAFAIGRCWPLPPHRRGFAAWVLIIEELPRERGPSETVD